MLYALSRLAAAVPAVPALFIVGFVACIGCVAEGVEPNEGYDQKPTDARHDDKADGTKNPDDGFYDDDWRDNTGGSDNNEGGGGSANGGMENEGGMGGNTENTGGTGGHDPFEESGGMAGSAGSSGSDTGGSSGTGGGASGTGGGASGTGGGASGTGGASGGGGSSGTSGSGGGGGSSGSGGSGGGTVCNQHDNEPNNTEAASQHLGDITDNDGDGSATTGTLKNTSDKDWFSLRVRDTAFHTVKPTWKVETATPIDVCVFMVCETGTTAITCNSPATASTSPEGKSGCCATLNNSEALTPKLNCTGTNNETSMSYVSVSSPNTPWCAQYRLIYHY